MTFGLITEGPTDQLVLRTLLARFFADPDIDTRTVQPNVDSTDKKDHFGGWKNVLNYCSSPDMAAALEANDYVVIQLDTDVCEEYGVMKRQGGQDKTTEEIFTATKEKIIESISLGLYNLHKDKVIFAISYNEIECWLLPLYFNNNLRTKTINCCDQLNQALAKVGFTVDCGNKQVKYYNKICKNIKGKDMVVNMSAHNNSFNQFVQQLTLIEPLYKTNQ
jgi:hypothetical protein